jgi:high-affinity nickel-transport protein
VVGLAVAVALTTTALEARFDAFKAIGGLVGTTVSALFLFAIAAANILVLAAVYRALRIVKGGGQVADELMDSILPARGFLGRLFRPLFRMIQRSWHMYPLGILFGLGFDTATEVGFLGISAAQASQGTSLWSILVFAALFTAGMSLVDTTDSVMMVGAYGWAFVKPLRKLYYNLAITLVSVVAALVIGGIETLTLVGEGLGLEGRFWDVVGWLGSNFGALGYCIVALFVASWLLSFLVYRARGYEDAQAPT